MQPCQATYREVPAVIAKEAAQRARHGTRCAARCSAACHWPAPAARRSLRTARRTVRALRRALQTASPLSVLCQLKVESKESSSPCSARPVFIACPSRFHAWGASWRRSVFSPSTCRLPLNCSAGCNPSLPAAAAHEFGAARSRAGIRSTALLPRRARVYLCTRIERRHLLLLL